MNRIHIEDFAQAFGVYPEDKYERASYRNLAEVIWTEAGEALICRWIVSWQTPSSGICRESR